MSDRSGPGVRAGVVRGALVLAIAACTHTEPFTTAPFDANGPYRLEFPRPLTFNPGDDRYPSATGNTLVYSRLEAGRADEDRCLAFLPVEGGTLERVVCPNGDVADAQTDAWMEPAISPDGARVVYLRQRGLRSADRPSERAIVMAPFTAPESATVVLADPYDLPDGREGTGLRALSWANDGTLRFLAGIEFFNTLSRDTVWTSFGIVELDIATGVIRFVPGAADAFSYTTGPSGEVWVTFVGDSVVWLLAPDGTPSPVAVFPHPITGVARAGETCVAIVEFPSSRGPAPMVMGMGPGDVVPYSLWNGFVPRRLAAVPGTRRVVAEIHRGDDVNVFGNGSNLWLLEAR